MAGTLAIVIVRDDFYMPGTTSLPPHASVDERQLQFFELVNQQKPDVIVLDLSEQHAEAVTTITTIRARTSTPILAVLSRAQVTHTHYRTAGAAECIQAPIEILAFNQALHRVAAVGRISRHERSCVMSFAGMRLQPEQDRLVSGAKDAVLTTSERRILSHFLSKPWEVCSRREISEVIYDRHPPSSDRAVDIIINRLRKKLTAVGGPAARMLIRTEFRRGYLLATEVTTGFGRSNEHEFEVPV